MKKCLLLFLMLSFAWPVFGGKAVSFPELIRPDNIAVDKELLVITDGTTIHLYSLKDFKQLKRFGKSGEGPQEFMIYPNLPLRVKLMPGYILVNSIGKISYYTRKGEYIKEMKHTILYGTAELLPIGDRFAAMNLAIEKDNYFITSNIYDAGFKKITEMARAEFPVQGQKFRVLKTTFLLGAVNNRIFVCGSEDFVIDIFDPAGKKLNSIKQPYKNLPFGSDDKKEMLDYYKANPATRQFYDAIRNGILWPDRFPAIRSFSVDERRLYVQSFQVKDGKTDFYVFDHNGKLLAKPRLPIARIIPVETQQLFTIYNQVLYQLIENEDEEKWELHTTALQ
ncbi:MAG: hypothetical protein L0Y73_08000 [Candidatus Aminicenantes bacterium]|nr:hypothetical protein [Candidatus Aminicenantes bacterium]